MTDRSTTDTRDAVALAAMEQVAVECVFLDGAGRPGRRRLMPLAVLLAPLEGLVSPVRAGRGLPDRLRDAS